MLLAVGITNFTDCWQQASLQCYSCLQQSFSTLHFPVTTHILQRRTAVPHSAYSDHTPATEAAETTL